jgi:glycosyltransferase involved in cell wall biosynthesis
MTSLPKISVIIPTFNCEVTLEACLQSVINQTYPNTEILVIDGQSQDSTLDILKRYQEKLIWVSEQDKGIYDAMNKGIELATGEWLYFLGSDDVLYNEHVLESIFSNSNHLRNDVLYGNVKFKISGICYDGEFSSYKLLHKNICHQAIFVKKKIFQELGMFETKYKLLADWYFNMHWYNHSKIRHSYLNLIIAVYDEDGLSFNHPDEQFIKDKSKIENLNFPWVTRFMFRNRHRPGFRQLVNLIYCNYPFKRMSCK